MNKKYIHLKLLIVAVLSCLLCTQACRKMDATVQRNAVAGAQAKATTFIPPSNLGVLQVMTLRVTGSDTTLSSPDGIVVDAIGNTYVSDAAHNFIRKIDPTGNMTTFAGSGTATLADGQGKLASFNAPAGLAIDAAGNIIVADKGNNCIRKITPDSIVTTIAGASNADYVDGAIAAARFNSPSGVAVDTAGNNILVADTKNQCLRVISLNANQVITLAGKFNQPDTTGGTIGTQGSTRFKYPFGVTIDAFSNILITDSNSIRKIANGTTTTLAGSGSAGFNDATGPDARFKGPAGIITDAAGNAYVADRGNNRIRIVSPAGSVTTYTGGTAANLRDGVLSVALFNSPAAIAFDASGYINIADQGNNRVRKTGLTTTVSTFAGSDYQGTVDGPANTAQFDYPDGITVDGFGNVYVADKYSLIRKITPAGQVSTLAGNQLGGYVDGTGSAAMFRFAQGLAADAAGNVYVADAGNCRIRKVTPAGVVTTYAGSGPTMGLFGSPGGGYADGSASHAMFAGPSGIAIDLAGNMYVADYGNNRVRKITPDSTVSTLAGNGMAGDVDGPPGMAEFNGPTNVAVDVSGNVYVTEANNNRVRKVTPNGTVSTLVGGSVSGFRDGPAATALFTYAEGITVDGTGNIYVIDNNRIRRITPTGGVTTIAGNGITGVVDGPGSSAEFYFIVDLAISPSGSLYAIDYIDPRVRKIQ